MRVVSGFAMLDLLSKNYQTGTIAHCVDGGYWTRIDSGWLCSISNVIRTKPDGFISHIEVPFKNA